MNHLVRPMLATLVAAPFTRPGWVNEEKYDGIRALAYRKGETCSACLAKPERAHPRVSGDRQGIG